jgi:hypothetical protein
MTLEDFEGQDEGINIDLGTDLGEVPDMTSLPDGSEANLKLTDIDVRVSKKTGGKFIYALLDPFEEPNAKLINHVMMLPTEGDTDKAKNNRLRAVRDFYTAFGIPLSGSVDLREYIGNTSWAILKEEEDAEYGSSNRVRRWVPGK